jgi:hypothetical protein
MSEVTRRAFTAGAVAATGYALLAPKEVFSVPLPAGASWILFDPSRVDACNFAGECSRAGSRTMPVTGDVFRFAREWIHRAGAPQSFGGVTNYADFVVMSGTAAEAGYRVVSERRIGTLTAWVMARRRE